MSDDVESAVEVVHTSSIRVGRGFVDAVERYSSLAHARRAGNGWGGIPIPSGTGIVANWFSLVAKSWLRSLRKRDQ